MDRRRFLRNCGVTTAASVAAGPPRLLAAAADPKGQRSLAAEVAVDPRPRFRISPYLYMQFMEPLGNTDGSVEAAWDYDIDDWREDLIAAVRDLSPDVVRWGGNFSRYYKWREGVGPLKERPWMYNYLWGGKETNRVGTHEFVDFCRRVGAEPLMCVNFLSDGRQKYWRTVHGENRRGDAREAADWVSYANDPDNAERIRHGVREPYDIKLWQIGNETSYGTDGFDLDEAAAYTVDFAAAMRARDPSIQLIGWGDRYPEEGYWAGDMIDRAGEHLDYIAVHMMGMGPVREDTMLEGRAYQKDPEQAWEELLELTDVVEQRVHEIKEIVHSRDPAMNIAVTEGHVSFDPYNANPILHEWLSAVYHARTMNIYQRNGDKIKICTGADFCGTRWTVNAVKMPVPRGESYAMPVGSIMRLFGKYRGMYGVAVEAASPYLDVAASRSGEKVYLHIVNLNYRDAVEAVLAVEGMEVTGGRVYEIAPEDPREYVNQNRPHVFDAEEKPLPRGDTPSWRFPGASVSVVELDVQA